MGSLDDAFLRRGYTGRAFERPGEDIDRHAARAIFFQAVHRVEPRVVGHLMGEPLELYRPLFEAILAALPEDQRPWWHVRSAYLDWGTIQYASDRNPPEVHRLRDLILRWGQRWRLGDDWCLESAVETLARLSAAGDDAEPEPLSYPGTQMVDLPFRDDETRFDFSVAGWSPTIEDWGLAEERIDGAYARAKQTYRRRIEGLCREEGLVEASQTRSRKGDPFEWLARLTVGHEYYSEVALDAGVTRQAVQKAAKDRAALIGLAMPPHLAPPSQAGPP